MYRRYSNVRTMHAMYKNCLVSRGVSKNIIGYNSFRIILAAVSRPGSYNQGLSYFYVDLLNCILTLMDCIGRMSKLSSNANQFYTASENVPDISDEAVRDSENQIQLNLDQQDWEKLKLVEQALQRIKSTDFGSCQQ